MQAQMREIEQADASRREFIANVSHDLRTPLASIQGYLDTLSLKNGTLTAEERHQYLQIALNQAKSLNQLINTLFYLTKLDSGQIALQPEHFRIDEMVQDVVQKFALQAQNKNIRLIAEAHGKLPFVCADLGLIERALSNLIDNALRHTPEGGSVQLRLQQLDDKIWVSVIDSGCGIAEADLPHIFKRFYRGDSARGESAINAGLGLSIVHRIVDMHGEVVEASNATGQGAHFRFSLRSVESSDTPCTREQFPA
jgi:signal transduction histidine kinase